MAPDANGSAPPSGLTLYANLLKPTAGQISSAPVMYNQKTEPEEQTEETTAKPAKTDFRQQLFQRTKRPQQKKTTANRPGIPNLPPSSSSAISSSSPDRNTTSNAGNQPAKPVGPVTTTSAADWISREEDDNEYLDYARPARPKKRKKNKKENEQKYAEIDWDAPYDPTQPTNYELYKDSDEALADDNDWWNKLHAHQLAVKHPRQTRSASAEDDGAAAYAARNRGFAPPPSFDDAPGDVKMADASTTFTRPAPGMSALPDDEEEAYRPAFGMSKPPVATSDDAWAQRGAMSMQFATPAQQSPPKTQDQTTAAPPKPANSAAALLSAISSSSISRAPVQYERPPPEMEPEEEDTPMTNSPEPPAEDADAPRSTRPGQRDFAKRLLMKHGWKEGQGLGATGSGMLKPLQVKLDKRTKKSDAEGGGWRNRGGTGKIIGGRKPRGIVEDEDVLGKMSEVVVILGALDGVDVDHEIGEGLYQSIGDECNAKYGSVARIVINPATQRIFIKFTQSLSALRAVQALNTKGIVEALQGRNAEGSVATACYYIPEDFERGVFDKKLKIEETLKADEEAALAEDEDVGEGKGTGPAQIET